MFDFKISLSSFRLCRRKSKSPATAHFFSPFNPKAREITYPTIPSPPPTTPIYRPHITAPITTTPEAYNSPPVSFTVTCSDTIKDGIRNNMVLSDESGWFSSGDGEVPESRSESVDSFQKEGFMLSGGACRKVMEETLTVVQWSDHPQDDFKKSMLEMILEKRMFEAKDLEQLLQCFLTLNSRNHHAHIVAAFTEIWELLFR